MFDHAHPAARVLTGARIVTPDGIVDAGLAMEDGRIVGLTQARDGRDLDGAFLIPGIVDLHTDHVERHTHPRVGVLWPALPALLAYDAVIVSGGTTTVFDSLSVGAAMQKQDRRERLEPMVSATRGCGACSGPSICFTCAARFPIPRRPRSSTMPSVCRRRGLSRSWITHPATGKTRMSTSGSGK
jgi:hypothetical protein